MTRRIEPMLAPLGNAVISVPGSKSISNRALVIASLARGRSEIIGALHADDTDAMVSCLRELGTTIERRGRHDVVEGRSGAWAAGPRELHLEKAATVARFLLPSLLLGSSTYKLDGHDQLKRRPVEPLIRALRQLHLGVTELESPGALPLEVTAPEVLPSERRIVEISGDVSSQFLSGLLLAGPCLPGGLEVNLNGSLVSEPYIRMTTAVMHEFGAQVTNDHGRFIVEPTGYTASEYLVEPDASAASYFFAAAAICGGSVRIDGLSRGSLQGDLEFLDVLEKMGVKVNWADDYVQVTSSGQLHGISSGVNMANFSDTAQTLAVVAPFADAPTKVTGIGFIRAKETDRIGHVVTQLQRCGVRAVEEDDGFTVFPGVTRPASRSVAVDTYGDHRMAMSFSLLGLATPGIEIQDPGCVSKTFPEYWDVFDGLYTAS